MTHSSADLAPLSCDDIREAIVLGAAPGQARAIAAHLAGCRACRALHATYDRDRQLLHGFLDDAPWLPIEHVPTPVPARRAASGAAGGLPWAAGRDETVVPPVRPEREAAAGSPRPLATGIQAVSLILLGAFLATALRGAWPGLPDLAGHPEGPLGSRPGIEGTTRPGPGQPTRGLPEGVALPPSTTTTGQIDRTAAEILIPRAQHHATWAAVAERHGGTTEPVLAPVDPPPGFVSVVATGDTTNGFTVRYEGDGIRLTIAGGWDATSPISGETWTSWKTEIQGHDATVSLWRPEGTPRGDELSAAPAPGTLTQITWRQPGRWQADPRSPATQPDVPYLVTAEGLPVEDVIALASTLAPVGDPWRSALAAAADTSVPLVIPATLPEGFVPVTSTGTGSASDAGASMLVFEVAYARHHDRGQDRIVFAGGPFAVPAGGSSRPIEVMGVEGVRWSFETEHTESVIVAWEIDGQAYRVAFTGPAVTDAEIRAVLDGLTMVVP